MYTCIRIYTYMHIYIHTYPALFEHHSKMPDIISRKKISMLKDYFSQIHRQICKKPGRIWYAVKVANTVTESLPIFSFYFSISLTFVTILEMTRTSSCSQLLQGINKENLKAKQRRPAKVVIFTNLTWIFSKHVCLENSTVGFEDKWDWK